MTINNKSERNYRGKCLGWPVTSYGGGSGISVRNREGIFFYLSRYSGKLEITKVTKALILYLSRRLL